MLDTTEAIHCKNVDWDKKDYPKGTLILFPNIKCNDGIIRDVYMENISDDPLHSSWIPRHDNRVKNCIQKIKEILQDVDREGYMALYSMLCSSSDEEFNKLLELVEVSKNSRECQKEYEERKNKCQD